MSLYMLSQRVPTGLITLLNSYRHHATTNAAPPDLQYLLPSASYKGFRTQLRAMSCDGAGVVPGTARDCHIFVKNVWLQLVEFEKYVGEPFC